MKQQLVEAIKYWDHIAPVVRYPKNKKELNELVSELDELLEIVGDDEDHHLMGLVDTISNLIASYEETHFQNIKTQGIDALKLLMETNRLSQSDLPEIGNQEILSEILGGRRALSLHQIKLLASRFNVDISTFMDD